jgi:hypothetical protein
MAARGNNILLLVDNAPGHRISQLEYSNVKIEFLLPNTTSCLQPMDAGIIHSFKANYRRRWVQWRTDEIEASRFDSRLDIDAAVFMITRAWDAVSESTIANCWRKTGIVPSSDVSSVLQSINELSQTDNDQRREILDLLGDTFQDHTFTEQDVDLFITDPEEDSACLHEAPTDGDIVRFVAATHIGNENDPDLAPDSSESIDLTPNISLKQAREGARDVLHFLVMNHNKPELLKAINTITSALEELSFSSKKQTSLDSFLVNQ